MDAILPLIRLALSEDVGSGDITTNAVINDHAEGVAEIRAKADLVVACLDVAHLVFREIDPTIQFEAKVSDGDCVKQGDVLAVLRGRLRTLLTGERVALNFLQHLAGVATMTRQFVNKVSHTNAVILDTRKTLPGYRLLEKAAVVCGGGANHRMGLYDRYMIKNNHIDAAGSVETAMDRVKADRVAGVLVEVEARTIEEVNDIMEVGADIVLLDNMSIDTIRQSLAVIAGRAKTEVSGGVSLETVAAIAETGVDYISVGAITHSVPAADIHMRIVQA